MIYYLPILGQGPFLIPHENIIKGFLIFSGDIKRELRPELTEQKHVQKQSSVSVL